jgi:hypothetical protein
MSVFRGWFQYSKWRPCLRGLLLKDRFLLSVFCGQNDSMQRIFIIKCFLFTVGSVCRVKQFTTGFEIFSQGRSKVADDARAGAEVAETTVKRLLCCWFRRTGKAMGQVYQCFGKICRGTSVFFSGSNIICFTFYIHL